MAGATPWRSNKRHATNYPHSRQQTHCTTTDLHVSDRPGHGRVVLIVDDDPDFLLQHSTVLKSLGFEVVTAAARAQAEELLGQLPAGAGRRGPDDGGKRFRLYPLPRNQAAAPEAPIVVVTSASSLTGYDFESLSGDQRTWIQADAVLAKPIRFDQLKAQVNRLLDR